MTSIDELADDKQLRMHVHDNIDRIADDKNILPPFLNVRCIVFLEKLQNIRYNAIYGEIYTLKHES